MRNCIYKAITATGSTCHFGQHSYAQAWAGPGGRVEKVELKPRASLQLVDDPADALHEVRDWINDLPIPRPKGTARISMVLAQAMRKLGFHD